MANIGDKFIARSLVPGVPAITVVYIGMQETGFKEFPDFALYNLTSDLPGHPTHSTVGKDVLEENGFVLPPEAP
jgi:hypothetical protein